MNAIEYCDLQSDNVEDGVNLLNRARVAGIASLYSEGWISLSPSPSRHQETATRRLVANNLGIFVHQQLVPSLDEWGFEVFLNSMRVSYFYISARVNPGVESDDLNLASLARILKLSTPLEAALENAFGASIRIERENVWSLANAFSTCLGLSSASARANTSIIHRKEIVVDVVQQRKCDAEGRDISSCPFAGRGPNCQPCPNGAFGTSASVRTWSRRFAKSIDQAETWRDALRIEPVTCGVHSRDIALVEECKFLVPTSERLWRPYLASETIIETWAERPSVMRSNLFPMVLAAMHSFWFLFGMLGLNADFRLPVGRQGVDLRDTDLMVLDRYVHWFPELEQVSGRCVYAQNWIGRRISRPHWAMRAVVAALTAGWKPSNTLSALGGTLNDLRLMEMDGVIEQVQGRYRITDHFRRLAKSHFDDEWL